ncbi:MAG: methyltransferase domain-containing protein [Candidatus Limnocylindrales bacterium]
MTELEPRDGRHGHCGGHGGRGQHLHGSQGSEPWMPNQPDSGLVELAGALQPGRALDLGAGQGRNSIWLARQGWQVTAVDQSEASLASLDLVSRREHLGITTVVADMHAYLGRSEPFDLIVIAHIHPPTPERAQLLAEAARALAPGGHLFVVGHHVDALGIAGPPDPERLYTEEGLASAFPGLTLLRLDRREHPTGPGRPALVEVVAWATRPFSSEDAPA